MFLFVLAQAVAAVVAPAQAPPEAAGVTSYPPAFFAAQNPNSAADMVGRLPGFSLDTGDSVRGFEGAAGNVLIDGQRPASKSDNLGSILSRIPASKVERIDVIRGGAPGIDMQGKTVIANVVTRTGGAIHGLLAISNNHFGDGRDFGGLRAEASGALPGDRTWEVALRGGSNPDDGAGAGRGVVIHADGRPTERADLFSQGSGAWGSLSGTAETPLLGGRLRLNGLLDRGKFKEPETDRITAPVAEVRIFDFAQHNNGSEIGGRFTRGFGPDTNIELVGLRTTRDRKVDSMSLVSGSSSDFFNSQQSSETIVRGVLKRRFGGKIALEAGAETADNKLDSHTRFTVDGANQALPAANVQVEERRSEAFVKGTWRPAATWTVDGDVRYETSDISSAGDVILAKTLQFAKPRLTVSWAPVPATQLRVRLERTVGQLGFSDFVASSNLTSSLGVTAGNPNLNPEQAWVGEVAVEQQLWKGASVVLTGRHFKLTDVVDRGPVFGADGTVFDRPTNIGAGTKDELEFDVTLPFDHFGWGGAVLKGNVVQRWSSVTDPTTRAKREISNLRPLDWELHFTQDLPRFHLNLGIDVCCGWRRTAYRFNSINTLKLQTFVRPFAEWKPGNGLSFRVELPLINSPKTRVRDTFEIFPGPRSADGKPDIQDRMFHFPRGFQLRIRKDFG